MEPNQINQVRKRNGDIVDFDQTKISLVIVKALKVVRIMNNKFHPRSIPAIEEIQDAVE